MSGQKFLKIAEFIILTFESNASFRILPVYTGSGIVGHIGLKNFTVGLSQKLK